MRYQQTGLSFSRARPPSLCFALTNSRVEVRDHRSERDNDQLNGLAPFRPLKNLQSIPPCKLKAQTNVLRPSGSSVGCGQRTVFPSGESFKRDATSSPNSICASLVNPVVGTAYQQGKKKTHIGSRTNLPARFS